MQAVIKTGGKQYRVAAGDEIKIERLNGEVGDTVTFDKVLLATDGEQIKVGKPFLEDAKVMGKILRQGKSKKILVLKRKRRKGFRKRVGHRQQFSQVKIEQIL